MAKGYILVHRSLWEHWIWLSAKHTQRWLDIIYLAHWENRTIDFGSKKLELRRGQFVTTTRILMLRWKTNGDTVRRFLRLLESNNMIVCKRNRDMTIITVCNYNKYQRDKLLQFTEEVEDENSVITHDENTTENPRTITQDNSTSQTRKRSQMELNKEEKNQKNNSLSSREREQEFFNEIRAAQNFLEATAKNNHITTSEVIDWLEKFFNEMLCIEKSHKDLSDFKQHFYHWLNIQIKNLKHNGTDKSGGRKKASEDRHSARRGSDVPDHQESDYGGTF